MFMKSIKKNLLTLIVFTILGLSSTFAQGGKVRNLQDLIGEKGRNVEVEMANRDYDFINTTKSRGDAYENWWHSLSKKCVTLRFSNGYLKSAIYAPDYDCKKSGNSAGGTGLHRIVNQKASYADKELERMGYHYINSKSSGRTDYANWWNNSKRKCITVRLENGIVRSVQNTSASACKKSSYGGNDYNSGNNGNGNHSGNAVKVNDLVGWKALSAYDELESRGFREVKKFSSSGKTYRVWYNSRTRQCIKTLSQNKKITSIIRSTRCNN